MNGEIVSIKKLFFLSAILVLHLHALPPNWHGISKSNDGDIEVPVSREWVCSQGMFIPPDSNKPDSSKFMNTSVADQLSPYSGTYSWSYYPSATIVDFESCIKTKTLPLHLRFYAWDKPKKCPTTIISGITVASYRNTKGGMFQRLYYAKINNGLFALCWASREKPIHGEDADIVLLLIKHLSKNHALTKGAMAKLVPSKAEPCPTDLEEAMVALDKITNDKEKHAIRNSKGIGDFLSMGVSDFGARPPAFPGTRDVSALLQDDWGLKSGDSPIAIHIKIFGIDDPEEQAIFLMSMYKLRITRVSRNAKLVARDVKKFIEDMRNSTKVEKMPE